MNKTLISTAVATVIGATSLTANAALTSSAVLVFDEGVPVCILGGTPPACVYGLQTVQAGTSWFSMDTNGNGITEPGEKVAILADGGVESDKGFGIAMHDTTAASGSHAGSIDGSESTVGTIWEFFGGTGMNYQTSDLVYDANTDTVDMSGWQVGWNGIAGIPMGGDSANFGSDTGLATMVCDGDCSASDTFTLTYNAHVPMGDASGFGGVGYGLELVGTIGTNLAHIPVPAAVWLFGSGLLGLVGVARRKKA